MKTRQETIDFLDSLQWQRMSKRQLQAKLQVFFKTENELERDTDEDDLDVDYSYYFTYGEWNPGYSYIDIKIYYLKMRNGQMLITGTELLGYES